MANELARSIWNRLRPRRQRLYRSFFENVLGTSLEVQVVSAGRVAGSGGETAVLAEIRRLEAIFSVFAPDSELLRWSATLDEPVAVSEELAEALETAERWRLGTGGAFDPRTERHTRHWQAREIDSNIPDVQGSVRATAGLAEPLWTVERRAGEVTARKRTPDPINLNALAKGIIIDRACAAAASVEGVHEALVNLGGDLRHLGSRPIVVGIADPFVDAENVPPLASVRLLGEGMATSGGYRRGFRVDGRHRSHIIDPRTGDPAESVRNVTVVAESTATADALATAFSVLEPAESVALADTLKGVACLIVSADRRIRTSSRWATYAVESTNNPIQERQ